MDNICREPRYDEIVETLDRGGIPYKLVSVIPFSHELVPPLEVDGPVMVIGSLTLTRIAKDAGWGPGVFLNDNFDFAVWGEKYRPWLLNNDARLMRFEDVRLTEPAFIRPALDDKSFCGEVVDPESFTEWQEKVCTATFGATVDKDTMVVVAAPKHIHAEYRCFMVDGKLVTGSRYKLGGRVKYEAGVPAQAQALAEDMARVWTPDRAYVIDVAHGGDDDWTVVEIGSLNSCGFYLSDVSKLVQVLEMTFG